MEVVLMILAWMIGSIAYTLLAGSVLVLLIVLLHYMFRLWDGKGWEERISDWI